ncbi:cyclase family protein [Sulfurimonas sp. HSL1-2]|uniref:cyclase family protein n=1 Tax=Thiomicrolovo zhangzhouensis TaxID=3131933 RepID=UPI0031F7FB95
MEFIYLSHLLDRSTPSYGGTTQMACDRLASIEAGDVANESFLRMPAHMGTHVDMPLHFFEKGQEIESFDAAYWVFDRPLIMEVSPESLLIEDELIRRLEAIEGRNNTDLLLVKTGAEAYRGERAYWESNPGFSAGLFDVLVARFPKLRLLGFDTISVASFQHPQAGREAHRAFLNPSRPVLLLEDMHLADVGETTPLRQVVVAPLRISGSDGLPCTVLAAIE